MADKLKKLKKQHGLALDLLTEAITLLENVETFDHFARSDEDQPRVRYGRPGLMRPTPQRRDWNVARTLFLSKLYSAGVIPTSAKQMYTTQAWEFSTKKEAIQFALDRGFSISNTLIDNLQAVKDGEPDYVLMQAKHNHEMFVWNFK